MFAKRLLIKTRLMERRKEERIPAQDLIASCRWPDGERKRSRIKDISPRGISLLTEDRWELGTVVRLTIERCAKPGESAGPDVNLTAKAVHLSDDGVGLAFEHEFGDPEAWPDLMGKAVDMAPQKDAVSLFRSTRALAFLLCLSPAAESRIVELFSRRLRGQKAEITLNIVLMAADRVQSQQHIQRTDIGQDVLLHILEGAAQTKEKEEQQFWTGLLVSASVETMTDAEILNLVNLLSQLANSHLLLLGAACTRAMENGWKPGFTDDRKFRYPAKEIGEVTGIRNPAAVERDLNLLHVLGLLEQTVKSWTKANAELANLTPTGSGLEFYSKCCGKPGLPGAVNSPDLHSAS